jgi:hypothetical protein
MELMDNIIPNIYYYSAEYTHITKINSNIFLNWNKLDSISVNKYQDDQLNCLIVL